MCIMIDYLILFMMSTFKQDTAANKMEIHIKCEQASITREVVQI